MGDIETVSTKTVLQTLTRRGTLIPLKFTTSASGVPTLEDDYDGVFSIDVSTDTYTITGPSAADIEVLAQCDQGSSLDIDTSGTDPAAGTIELAFSSDFDSGTCTVLAFYQTD